MCDPSVSALIGVARRDTTPLVGIYNRSWGAAKHDVAEGVHRPLTATAVAIRPSRLSDPPPADQPLVLVALDAGYWQVSKDESYIRDAVLQHCGLDPSRLMIAFSHTHSGPSLTRGDADRPGGELIAAYLDHMRNQIIEAANEAIRNARPAILAWTYGKCNMAANRDLPEPSATAGGQQPPKSAQQSKRIVCGYNPAGQADDTLLVGRITDDASGRVIGSIVNYACHPTTLAWDNRLISPDYVGAMREIVEQHTGEAPCLFVQGCSGELAPREQYVGDTAIADRNGRQLGYAALSALESMLPPRTALQYTGVVESGAPLATWGRVPHAPTTAIGAQMIHVALPLKPLPSEAEIEREAAACGDRVVAERLRRKLRVRQAVGTGATCTAAAWIWRLGDAFLVGQPNEPYSAFQVALRRAFPNHAVGVMNVVNGALGYLAPAAMHDLDIYQVWQSPFDRDAFDRLMTACTETMTALQ